MGKKDDIYPEISELLRDFETGGESNFKEEYESFQKKAAKKAGVYERLGSQLEGLKKQKTKYQDWQQNYIKAWEIIPQCSGRVEARERNESVLCILDEYARMNSGKDQALVIDILLEIFNVLDPDQDPWKFPAMLFDLFEQMMEISPLGQFYGKKAKRRVIDKTVEFLKNGRLELPRDADELKHKEDYKGRFYRELLCVYNNSGKQERPGAAEGRAPRNRNWSFPVIAAGCLCVAVLVGSLVICYYKDIQLRDKEAEIERLSQEKIQWGIEQESYEQQLSQKQAELKKLEKKLEEAENRGEETPGRERVMFSPGDGSGTNLREEPEETDDNIIQVVPSGALAVLLEDKEDAGGSAWSKVQVEAWAFLGLDDLQFVLPTQDGTDGEGQRPQEPPMDAEIQQNKQKARWVKIGIEGWASKERLAKIP